jgi:hypothetical protein
MIRSTCRELSHTTPRHGAPSTPHGSVDAFHPRARAVSSLSPPARACRNLTRDAPTLAGSPCAYAPLH